MTLLRLVSCQHFISQSATNVQDVSVAGSPQQQVAIRSPPVVVDLGDAQAPPSGSDDEVAVDNARTRPLDTRNQVVTSQSRRSVVASGHPIVLPDGRESM